MDPSQNGEVAGTGSYADDTPLATLHDVRGALGPLARGEDAGRLVGIEDAVLIDLLGELRMIRGVLGAVEARVQVAFDASQRASRRARSVRAPRSRSRKRPCACNRRTGRSSTRASRGD